MNKIYTNAGEYQRAHNHYFVDTVPVELLETQAVRTFNGYQKKRENPRKVELYITPRGVIYYLEFNPESTVFCRKVICAPLGRDGRKWHYILHNAGVPRKYINAFARRYREWFDKVTQW